MKDDLQENVAELVTDAAAEGAADGPAVGAAPASTGAPLAGARVIELKTVQVLDRLEIPRPCIDAADVGRY